MPAFQDIWSSHNAIERLVLDLNTAAAVDPGKVTPDQRDALLQACERIRAVYESPVDAATRIMFGNHQVVAMRLAVDMELFDAASEKGGEITIEELASKTEADPVLIRRIIRILAKMGIFTETALETFALTRLGSMFHSKSPLNPAVIHLSSQSSILSKLPAYFEEKGYQNPSNNHDAPFQFATGYRGHYFDWLKEHPREQDAFNTILGLAQKSRGQNWFEFFPVKERFVPALVSSTDGQTEKKDLESAVEKEKEDGNQDIAMSNPELSDATKGTNKKKQRQKQKKAAAPPDTATEGVTNDPEQEPQGPQPQIINPDTPFIVDIGGGLGHDLIAFHKAFPEYPGNLILQDLHEAISTIKPDSLPQVITPIIHNFFTPQPNTPINCRHAKIYYMRTVLHDWPDEEALKFLRQVKEAMGEESILLIEENVMPEENVGLYEAELDMFMMAMFASQDRTVKQFEVLLEGVGLKLVGVWKGGRRSGTLLEVVLDDSPRAREKKIEQDIAKKVVRELGELYD